LLAFIAVDSEIADNVVHEAEVLLFELVKRFLAASDEKMITCLHVKSDLRHGIGSHWIGRKGRFPTVDLHCPKTRLARAGEIGGVYITNWHIILFLGKELLS